MRDIGFGWYWRMILFGCWRILCVCWICLTFDSFLLEDLSGWFCLYSMLYHFLFDRNWVDIKKPQKTTQKSYSLFQKGQRPTTDSRLTLQVFVMFDISSPVPKLLWSNIGESFQVDETVWQFWMLGNLFRWLPCWGRYSKLTNRCIYIYVYSW